jgi:hypothetical protein
LPKPKPETALPAEVTAAMKVSARRFPDGLMAGRRHQQRAIDLPGNETEIRMIYFKQDFDIDPASPATRDRFVELAEGAIVPGTERIGGRLVGAWFNHARWYSQITHVTEFESLAAFESAREKAREDAEWRDCVQQIASLAPQWHESLLEPLGPIAPSRLHAAIEQAADQPEGAHTFAILEVRAGQMERFVKMIGGIPESLPILTSWRHVAGKSNEIIDLWKGDLGRAGYEPSNPGLDAFFGPLREVAPAERLVSLFPLPYSPLR